MAQRDLYLHRHGAGASVTRRCPDKEILGRYAFTRPAAPGLRQLRDPHTDGEDDDGEQG
ncbi:hypothetical protein ACFXKS_10950 [Streptomyces scopuliridis]